MLVSVTVFDVQRFRDIPSMILAAMGLLARWRRVDGSVSISLFARPLRRQFGALSLWEGERDLQRFLSSPPHVAVVRRFRTRMSGRSESWSAPYSRRLRRIAAWRQGALPLPRED